MIIKKYKDVNVNKLHTELNNANIFPFPVSRLKNGDCEFTFADGTNMELVQQIIDKHDPIPLPSPLTEIELLKISQAEQFELILEFIGGM